MGALLIAMLAIPAVAIAALYATPKDKAEKYAAQIGLLAGALVLLCAVVLAIGFKYGSSKQQAVIDWSWVPAIKLRFHLAVDGISLPLILLTALLSALCFFYSIRYRPGSDDETATPRGSARAYTSLLLLLEIGMLGTFFSADLLLFFVFFEIVLLPMYVLIARWGGDGAQAAANKFILYTLLGSALMLVGFLIVYGYSNTFDMTWLSTHRSRVPKTTALAAFALMGLGFAIKTPMFPFHTWLPDAHTAAPTTGSVLLAGVLLKMGTYGFVRIAVPILPDAAHRYAPAIAAFGVVGVIYGSLACLAIARRPDGDLKRLIAYSSVGHMGFVLIGIGTLTTIGMNAALFASVAHGLITGLLFFLVGGLKERRRTARIDEIGRALYRKAPKYGALVAFAAMASLGLPGLAGFWGEVLALYAATKPAHGLSQGTYIGMGGIAAVGLVLTAAYLLTVVRRICMGPEASADDLPVEELTLVETATWTPLAFLTLAAGLWPALVLGITNPAVKVLMKGV